MMSIYVSLFTVTIPVSYTSELPVAFEATAYICRHSIKLIRPVDTKPEIYLFLLVSHVTVILSIYARCSLTKDIARNSIPLQYPIYLFSLSLTTRKVSIQ